MGFGFLFEVLRSHSDTHTHTHTRYDSSRRAIGPSQRLLITHNIHNRQTSMPPAGIETAIPESKRSQTDALDRASTRINQWITYFDVFLTVHHSIDFSKYQLSAQSVRSPPAYSTAAYRGWRYQRLWWYNWPSWGWAACCSKHVEECNVTYILLNITRIVH